jgi:hypothetical protein
LRLILSIILGVLLGLLFLRLDYNQQAFQNISAVIFVLIVNTTFANVQRNANVILKRNYVNFFLYLILCNFRLIVENYHYFSKNMMMESIVQCLIMHRNLF